MFRKSTGLAAVIVLSVAVGGAVLATSGSFDPHGKPPTKGYVAVEAYKWLRDNAPDAIAGCEKTVDRFDDLRQPGVSKFKREAINCLDSVGFFDNYPVADPAPGPGQDVGSGTSVEAPVVQVPSGTSTELAVVFEAVVRVGETRAYDFGIRTKDPRGSWIEACKTFRNTSGRAGPAVFEQGFSGLEPETVYEVRYRYRNSSQCGRGSPTAWSAIGEGTTGAEESGSSSGSSREAPVVQVPSGTSTELVVVFEDVFVRVGVRAYDFGIRTKDPRGSWIEACRRFRNPPSGAVAAVMRPRFSGLEPETVYEVRYRYRNSSECGRGSPSGWSAIGEGTTGAEESGSSSRSYRAGDAIPGFPAGFSALSGAFRNGVQVTAVGGVVTITMSNGGTAEYADATYTCASAGGCVIEDGRVIRGIVIAS